MMIYSVNAKYNVMFEVAKEYFCLESEQFSNEVLDYFDKFSNLMKEAHVVYSELKNCLMPSNGKKEICLIFDTTKINAACYGRTIFENLLPLFKKDKAYNVKYGDLIDRTGYKKTDVVLDLMCNSCEIPRVDEHRYTCRYFLVYINNLSKTDYKTFFDVRTQIPSCIGAADMTYSSKFKSYISGCIESKFIVYKNKILCGHEPDHEGISNKNMPGFTFQENGFDVISISSDYFSIFLDYIIDTSEPIRIPDKKYKEMVSDIISNGCNLNEQNIVLDDKKLGYLINEKHMQDLFDKKDLKNQILSKVNWCLKNNIIYRLDFSKKNEHNVILFSVFFDINQRKVTCGIKYDISEKKLEIETMY